jgi:hypothetical protein
MSKHITFYRLRVRWTSQYGVLPGDERTGLQAGQVGNAYQCDWGDQRHKHDDRGCHARERFMPWSDYRGEPAEQPLIQETKP